MGVSVVRRRLWKIPISSSRHLPAEDGRIQRGSISHWIHLLFRMTVGLLIIVLLLGIVWVVPSI